MPEIDLNKYYTPSEIAYITDQSYETITYHIRKGDVKATKHKGGRLWWVSGKDLSFYLHSVVNKVK